MGNKILIFLAVMSFCVTANAQSALKESDFHFQTDLQTKYVWRGMEMITEDASPVVFPQLNYQKGGFFAYVMGATALNGNYSELDFGVSYTHNWLTVGFNDYYYPTTNVAEDAYLNLKNSETGHWMEASLTVAPENMPLIVTLSNFFYGADKYIDGNGDLKQAGSTYIEVGTFKDFLNSNRIALNIGLACNKSCYNGYAKGLGLCNIELKYTYNLECSNGWAMPLNASFIYNPVYDKPFMNLSTSFAF